MADFEAPQLATTQSENYGLWYPWGSRLVHERSCFVPLLVAISVGGYLAIVTGIMAYLAASTGFWQGLLSPTFLIIISLCLPFAAWSIKELLRPSRYIKLDSCRNELVICTKTGTKRHALANGEIETTIIGCDDADGFVFGSALVTTSGTFQLGRHRTHEAAQRWLERCVRALERSRR